MYQLGGAGHIRIEIKIQPDAFLSCPPEQFQHLCAPDTPILLSDTFHMADMERNVQIPGNPDHFFQRLHKSVPFAADMGGNGDVRIFKGRQRFCESFCVIFKLRGVGHAQTDSKSAGVKGFFQFFPYFAKLVFVKFAGRITCRRGADGPVARQHSCIHASLRLFQGVHVEGERLRRRTAPFSALFFQIFFRQISCDAAEKRQDLLTVFLPRRRHRKSAVPVDHRGDPLPVQKLVVSAFQGLPVAVPVDIDKARRHITAFRVQNLFPGKTLRKFSRFCDLADHPVLDHNVARKGRLIFSIYDLSVCYNIICHCLHLFI